MNYEVQALLMHAIVVLAVLISSRRSFVKVRGSHYPFQNRYLKIFYKTDSLTTLDCCCENSFPTHLLGGSHLHLERAGKPKGVTAYYIIHQNISVLQDSDPSSIIQEGMDIEEVQVSRMGSGINGSEKHSNAEAQYPILETLGYLLFGPERKKTHHFRLFHM